MTNSKNRNGIKKFAAGTATAVVGSALFLTATPDANAEATYTLGDKVFSDNNGNYVQDAGDTGIPGITVSIRDYAGNFVGETVTDANGNYSFSGLSNGKYVVNFSVPQGYSNDVANIEADLHDEVDSDGPIDVLVEINGANINTLDQGFIPFGGGSGTTPTTEEPTKETPAPGGGGEVKTPEQPTGNLSIGNYVWWDANRNNMQDAGENPVRDLRVSLRDYAGNFVAETWTDANGNYSFNGLAEGTYVVNFHNPLDWSPAIANIEADLHDEVDSDGPIDVIVNLYGGSNMNIDQGYYGVGTPGGGGVVTPPGGGDNTNPPGGGDNTNPGGGDNTNPGGGDNTNPPGGGDNTNPGGGDNTNPGGGDNTNPGGGDNTNPGGGDNTTPPTGGETTPPAEGGNEVTPPTGGETTPPAEGGNEVTPPTAGETTPQPENEAEVGKTMLPDTGEKDNAGLIASLMALTGGAMLFGSRKRREN